MYAHSPYEIPGFRFDIPRDRDPASQQELFLPLGSRRRDAAHWHPTAFHAQRAMTHRVERMAFTAQVTMPYQNMILSRLEDISGTPDADKMALTI